MVKLYSPVVLGPGLTIRNKPSSPLHAVRAKDLQEYAVMRRMDFEDTEMLQIPKHPGHDNQIVQVFDLTGSAVTPDKIKIEDDQIVVTFLVKQSGYVVVFSIGGLDVDGD